MGTRSGVEVLDDVRDCKEQLQRKEALLLDMNGTFMFGEDRFGDTEDYSEYYKSIGGDLPDDFVNDLIVKVFDYLDIRYPAVEYRDCFPSLLSAIEKTAPASLPSSEINRIIETFSFHEQGEIPEEYVLTLRKLRRRFTLGLVADIWSPKKIWVDTFKKMNIWELFSAHSFSSDHGMVKPSPKPFEMTVNELGLPKEKCLVIGDSVRRDLGGALSAGIDCVLVGGAEDEKAVGSFPDLQEFCKYLNICS